MNPEQTDQAGGNEVAPDNSSANSPEEVEEDCSAVGERKKRNWFVALVMFLFGTVFYLAVIVAGLGAGVAWHYIDATAHFDMAEVADLNLGATVIDSKNRTIGQIGNENRIFVERSDLPDHFVDALIAAEDQRYLFHPGVDPKGSLRAAWKNYRASGIEEGGSTLTQQLARNVFNLEGRHMERKLTEMAVALRMEQHYSKDEILVYYLNRIYFGSGFYGIGSAAKGYFDKEVRDLTLEESALICGLIRSPSRFSPFANQQLAVEQRDRTLHRMHDSGRISFEELSNALASTTTPVETRSVHVARGQRDSILDEVEREVRRQIPDVPLDGAKVKISHDLHFQQKAAIALDEHLTLLEADAEAEHNSSPLQGALIILSRETGLPVVSVGSRDYLSSEYDRTADMKRPAGSAFLPILYAAAYESGVATPESMLLDGPLDNRLIMLGGTEGILGEWSTENSANKWEGPIPAGNALRKSKNAASARLGFQLGLTTLSEFCKKIGIQSTLRDRAGAFLGASEMTLTELTQAYAAFATNRKARSVNAGVLSVTSLDGNQLFRAIERKPTSAPLLAESTVNALHASIQMGEEEKPFFEKNGTTAGYTDAWHFGFNDEYIWGIWIGRDKFSTIGHRAFGHTTARPVAEKLFSLPPVEFAPSIEPETRITDRPRRPDWDENFRPAQSLIGHDPFGTLQAHSTVTQ